MTQIGGIKLISHEKNNYFLFCFILSISLVFLKILIFGTMFVLEVPLVLALVVNTTTSVAISPSAIYDFNEEFSIGASIGYLYNKSKSDYSANMFILLVLLPYIDLFVTIEFSGELNTILC